MKRAPSTSDVATLEMAARHLDRGALAPAYETLLPTLDRRAEQGDAACALAARLLRAQAESVLAPAPDAMAAALDRLLALVETQETQLRILQALLEERL